MLAICVSAVVLAACGNDGKQNREPSASDKQCWRLYDHSGGEIETDYVGPYTAKDMDFIYGTLNEMDGGETYTWEAVSAVHCEED